MPAKRNEKGYLPYSEKLRAPEERRLKNQMNGMVRRVMHLEGVTFQELGEFLILRSLLQSAVVTMTQFIKREMQIMMDLKHLHL